MGWQDILTNIISSIQMSIPVELRPLAAYTIILSPFLFPMVLYATIKVKRKLSGGNDWLFYGVLLVVFSAFLLVLGFILFVGLLNYCGIYTY